MKKWQMVLVSMMALMLLALTPLTALAQDGEAQAERYAPRFEVALAIVALWAGFAGKELTMTVFLRENQEPFTGAGVWAVIREIVLAHK